MSILRNNDFKFKVSEFVCTMHRPVDTGGGARGGSAPRIKI